MSKIRRISVIIFGLLRPILLDIEKAMATHDCWRLL